MRVCKYVRRVKQIVKIQLLSSPQLPAYPQLKRSRHTLSANILTYFHRSMSTCRVRHGSTVIFPSYFSYMPKLCLVMVRLTPGGDKKTVKNMSYLKKTPLFPCLFVSIHGFINMNRHRGWFQMVTVYKAAARQMIYLASSVSSALPVTCRIYRLVNRLPADGCRTLVCRIPRSRDRNPMVALFGLGEPSH